MEDKTKKFYSKQFNFSYNSIDLFVPEQKAPSDLHYFLMHSFNVDLDLMYNSPQLLLRELENLT